MWCPSSGSAQMEERPREDGGKRRDDDDDDESATDNVDSGFLSAGNMQVSGEIRDPGLTQSRTEEGGRQVEENAPGTTILAPSSATVADEPMRVIDSGVVEADLTEGLNQLTLKQSRLNPLSVDGGDLVRPEPTLAGAGPTLNRTKLQYQNDLLPSSTKKHAAINEDTWQFYYAQDDDGDTQLHIAIMQGYVEAALILIRLAPHPCLLNTYNTDWQSPLHLAVLTSQPLIVRRLILAGADPSLRNFRGNTALHVACANGDFACAKALTDPLSSMERNRLMPGQIVPALPQNLEQRNYNGEMCLHLATTNGHVNLVRLLLRLGADLEAREALAGRTALHLAMERGCRSVVNFLLQECKPCLDTQTYSGLTAYQLALCIDGQLARELVRCGAKPEPLPDSDSEGSSGNNSESSEDETYGEASYLPAIVKMRNAVEVKV